MSTDNSKKSRIHSFYKEFKKRHTFADKDIDVLINKFPNINMKNIPLAWVVPIDTFIAKCESIAPGVIKSIMQQCGLLIITVNAVKSKLSAIKELIKTLLADVYFMDFDIYDDYLSDLDGNDIMLG